MAEVAENYVKTDVAAGLRRNAYTVWIAALGVVLIWVAAIVLTPVAKASGVGELSGYSYHFFSYICHQMPERSFSVAGYQFAVCSRCFGVYFGLLAGIATYPLWRPIDETDSIPRFWLFLSLIPIAVDWSLTIFGIWENTFLSRFVTGALLGLACGVFIVPALVEISRNLVFRPPKDLRT
ncbi:MAG: DUF2085 domain-containing protein [Acidobacteriota bacterium]